MIRVNVILACVALSTAAALALTGQPTLQDKAQAMAGGLDTIVQGRSIHLDPAELNQLMHDSQVRLQLFDVRPEAAFNVFHLRDARRVRREDMQQLSSQPRFDAKALKVFIAADEADAERAWRYAAAAGVPNIYVLDGGVNLWLAVFRDHQIDARTADASRGLGAGFRAALGDRHPFALPAIQASQGRAFEVKARRLSTATKPAGGCGG